MKNDSITPAIGHIAFIGNYLPRRCGIATFTTDLCESIANEFTGVQCFALPVNDTTDGYPYPERVRFELVEKELDSYRRAAEFLNISNVDVVCLQHEYGIIGGRSAAFVTCVVMRDFPFKGVASRRSATAQNSARSMSHRYCIIGIKGCQGGFFMCLWPILKRRGARVRIVFGQSVYD